jgi:MYXO-CTERM domain-containing protein
MIPAMGSRFGALAAALCLAASASAQTITIDTSNAAREQTIDGFGTCLAGTDGQSAWFQQLYFDDLRASLLRFDLVPRFRSPYSDFTYNSPWFHNNPALPGPEGNNVRTYTGASDYTKDFAGRKAQIAVMGPDIDKNIEYYDFADDVPKTAGVLAQIGDGKKAELGDFKLFGALWSPAPWLKLSSGKTISGQSGIFPVNGTPWPFIWAGNFSGGKLDTSGTPRAEFDDSAVGGSGPTSALTQFARGLAAYLRGFQNTYGVKLYAVSIQNELNFETFYNSCSYRLSSEYIAALKAARAELDKYDDLKPIRIMGPEDLLGGDGYGMWQYGGGGDITHKNLQYLEQIAADPEAAAAIDFFCIHGYAADGVSAAGGTPQQWQWWVDGWTASPAAGLPSTAKGFRSYGKKSWMTETSGESTEWLAPASGFPGSGGFSIALKIHQALTTGRQSAWVYWQLSDGKDVANETLTDQTQRESSPKYVAAKHFFRFIRPGAVRAKAEVGGAEGLLASAYVHDGDGTLTVVLVNATPSLVAATLAVPAQPAGIDSFDLHTSSKDSTFVASTASVSGGTLSVEAPGYGVVTLVGQGIATGGSSGAGGGSGGGSGGASGSGAAANGGATGGGSAGAPGAPSASDDGGCGCRIGAHERPSTPWAALLGALLALLLRREARDRT